MTALRALVDWLLAPHCPLGCGERVRGGVLERHYFIEHFGDQLP